MRQPSKDLNRDRWDLGLLRQRSDTSDDGRHRSPEVGQRAAHVRLGLGSERL